MRVARKLQAEWDAKLRAAGFRDLESRDRDAPLSDRGNLHAVTETHAAHDELAARMEHGAAYTAWAQGLLHTRRFQSAQERRIWRAHADGVGLKTIAESLGITYHDARDAVNAVKGRVKRGNSGKDKHTWPRRNPHRHLSWDTSVKLAAVFLKTLMRS